MKLHRLEANIQPANRRFESAGQEAGIPPRRIVSTIPQDQRPLARSRALGNTLRELVNGCRVPSVAVRPMRPEDVAPVAELTTELGYPSTEDDVRRRYDLIINRPDASLFVAAARPATSSSAGCMCRSTHLLECDRARRDLGARGRRNGARNRRRSAPDRSGRGVGAGARPLHDGPAIEPASDRCDRVSTSISDTK